MAEEKNKKEENETNTPNPEKGKEIPKTDDSITEKDDDDRFAKLEEKLGKQGKEFEEMKEFVDGASIVINTLAFNPELKEAFQKKVKEQYGVVGGGQEPGKKEPEGRKKAEDNDVPSEQLKAVDNRVNSMEVSQRDRIVDDFEVEFGISKLPTEKKAEARKKVATFIGDFGYKVQTLPLPILKKSLEKAYVGTHAEELREKGKLEGFTQAKANEAGVMTSISGGSPLKGSPNKMSDGQIEWAKKLGVDPDEAAKGYNARDDEQTRVSKAEEKK